MAGSVEILCERQGSAGLVTLNRPQALNALTLGMVREMRRALDAWESDPAVTRVVVTGAGERAFCAGGDIRKLYDLGRAGRHDEALRVLARGIRTQRPSSSAIRSPMSRSSTASSWAAASASRSTAATASPASATSSPCRRSASASSPMSARPTRCRGCPGATGTYLALTGERVRQRRCACSRACDPCRAAPT